MNDAQPNHLKLPPFREDLSIEKIEDPDLYEPQWRLYDPVNHDYYRIGLLEYTILTFWHLNDIDKIVESVNKKTKLNITREDVTNFLQFLYDHGLLKPKTQTDIEKLYEKKTKQKFNKIKNWCKSYLFFKFKILNPDKCLDKTLPYVRFFYTKNFLYILSFALVLSIGLIIRSWSDFVTTSVDFFNFRGFVYFVIAILFSKLIH